MTTAAAAVEEEHQARSEKSLRNGRSLAEGRLLEAWLARIKPSGRAVPLHPKTARPAPRERPLRGAPARRGRRRAYFLSLLPHFSNVGPHNTARKMYRRTRTTQAMSM